MSTMIDDPRLIKTEAGARRPIAGLRRRLATADVGMLPVIGSLLVIWVYFQVANDRFLSPLNLTNLLLQMAGLGILAVGVILVLLLGEIDLSVGVVSGVCAAVMAVLNVKAGWPGPVAVAAALVAGAAIGFFQGFWITKVRVPAFIVTLAGFIGWQGVLLAVLGSTGTINLRDDFILALTGTFFPPVIGWVLGVVLVAVYGVSAILDRRNRLAAGLSAPSLNALILRLVAIVVVMAVVIAVLNADRGLPLAILIFLAIVIVFDLITRRTLFGRHIYAVGGNIEAARRASINTDNVRIAVFTLCSTLAAAGGVMLGSRLLAVNQSSGSGDLLLDAIAAAVIGGTSLFGGRGSVWAALWGALVIQSISNGMDLLAYPSPLKFIITGGVLLFAVTLDALARRRRVASGR